METKNIYQRMSAITDEINRVAKNLTVGVGKSAYKAAGEAYKNLTQEVLKNEK